METIGKILSGRAGLRAGSAGTESQGEWVDKLTGLTDAHITGVHLRLPGWGDDGPTLEIFQYNKSNQRLPIATNNPGFGHIAFQVDDVEEAVAAFLANGGSPVGELLVHQYPDGRYLTVRYVADPEGNVVELQSWSESRDKFSLLTDCIRIAEVQFSRINLKKVVSERRLFLLPFFSHLHFVYFCANVQHLLCNLTHFAQWVWKVKNSN